MSDRVEQRRPAGVAVLGATGSIGASTLDVMARHPQRYRAVALTAHRDDAGLFELCRKHGVTHWSQHVTISEARNLLRRAFRLAGSDDF